MSRSWRDFVSAGFLRFAAIYWALWATPEVLKQFSRLTTLLFPVSPYWRLWDPATRWVGTKLLGFAAPAVWHDSGGGDLPYYWSLVIVQLTVAGATATVWTLLSQGTRSSGRLGPALHNGLRFLLGVILLEYGAAKVIPVQFGSPDPSVLATAFGNLPPFQLLWAFMGASPVYTFFAGLMELIPGMLLFFRRTATVGALLAAAALLNVLALNIGYDVPVKLQLLHLLAASAWVARPGVAYVINEYRNTIRSTRFRSSAWAGAISGALLIVVLGLNLRENWIVRRTYGDLAPKPPLYGAYRVANLSPIQGTLGPEWQWSTYIVEGSRVALVQLPDGRVIRQRIAIDTSARTIVLTPAGDTLHYQVTDVGLDIDGRVAGIQLSAHLTRVREAELPLLSQPLRWVNEK